MSYFCEFCNYTAKNSSNFANHKKTQKHLVLSQPKSTQSDQKLPLVTPSYHLLPLVTTADDTKTAVLKCPICDRNFNHKSNLSRHKNNCKESCQNLNQDKYKELQFKLEISEKEKEMFKKLEQEKSEILKEKTQLLNTFMANANHIINKAQDNTKITAQAMQTVSVSALKYANDKFKNAPELLPIENFNINDLNFDNEEDKKQLTEILIYNAKQKSLDKLLGDHIVKCYKKDNPEEQSFHTTDCSRLNYIVRNLIEDALNWAVDKSGIKICSSIVKPLIEKCINLLLQYQKELIDDMTEGDYTNKEKVQTILALLMSIDKGSLESDINKYIAPFFNLNKSIL